jgi:hypothetical protein
LLWLLSGLRRNPRQTMTATPKSNTPKGAICQKMLTDQVAVPASASATAAFSDFRMLRHTRTPAPMASRGSGAIWKTSLMVNPYNLHFLCFSLSKWG